MLERLRDSLRPSRDDNRQRFFEMIDALNAESLGERPTSIDGQLGRLALRSRTLVPGDPQYLPSVEVRNLPADEVVLSARIWRYPAEATMVAAVRIRAAGAIPVDSRRTIGELAGDSAKIVVADKLDTQQHWAETGKATLALRRTISVGGIGGLPTAG